MPKSRLGVQKNTEPWQSNSVRRPTSQCGLHPTTSSLSRRMSRRRSLAHRRICLRRSKTPSPPDPDELRRTAEYLSIAAWAPWISGCLATTRRAGSAAFRSGTGSPGRTGNESVDRRTVSIQRRRLQYFVLSARDYRIKFAVYRIVRSRRYRANSRIASAI